MTSKSFILMLLILTDVSCFDHPRLATAESVAKFLYSREGSNDYMISESYNATSVSSEVKSNSNDGFLFAAQNDRDDQFYNLVLNGRRFRDTESFAVEAFSNENRNSSESLKHLIQSAYSTIIVRHLTGDERSQLEAYKRTQTSEYRRRSNLESIAF